MLYATWQDNSALWTPGCSLQVFTMRSGWACRLFEHGTVIQTAFPYDDRQQAMYAAESFAIAKWGHHRD
jgi:hypothetical protein